MAKTGRPKAGEGEQETVQIRVFPEMKAMIDELLEVLPMSTAQLMQQIAGADLREFHDRHMPQIKKVKAARAAADEVVRKAMASAEQRAGRVRVRCRATAEPCSRMR